MNIRTIIFAASLLMFTGASAHDFTATVKGQQLYFEITNKVKKTAAVTYNGGITERKAPLVNGIVEIPSKVNHNGVVYEINAIGQKAFSGAKKLKGIVIPSGIKVVGDFAFEGCDSLASIVFPGNGVKFGQGVFFKCTNIENVTLGSDWKTIDLSMFRWSTKLETINLPANIAKIKGLKKLKNLKAVVVDANNSTFSSHEGMLYNKTATILYGCPRAKGGKLVVKEGVETIQTGALIDCKGVTAIDLPTSLKTMSFREMSRMDALQYIIMRGNVPVMTAKMDEKQVFLLQLATTDVEIVVPSESKKKYVDALPTAAGEFCDVSASTVPYTVSATEMPGKKNIKGVKNFNKYNN